MHLTNQNYVINDRLLTAQATSNGLTEIGLIPEVAVNQELRHPPLLSIQ